jgi:hypothetical protein
MDQLLSHQWQRLLEIQQLQMDLMEELVRAREQTVEMLPDQGA